MSDLPSVAGDRAVVALRKWAVLLDSAFQVPGTKMRFGLDPIVGLIPWAGDLITGFFSVMIVIHAVRLRIPRVVILRMMLNTALDVATGVVPLLGDLFDAAFKANIRNLALLERHAHTAVSPTRGDYLFVGMCVLVIALLVTLPIVLIWWLFRNINWF
ncbi:MAG: DUF4112 domain-containing protein [Vicinamibacterales bacterium]